MSSILRKKLKKKQLEEVRHSTNKLLTNSDADMGGHLRKIETYDKLLATIPQNRWPQLIAAFCVILICSTTVWIAWICPMWYLPDPLQNSTRLTFTIEGEEIDIGLKEKLEWNDDLPFQINDIQLEELDNLVYPTQNSSGKTKMNSLEGAPWLHIKNGKIFLTSLKLDKGGNLVIENNNDGSVILYANNAPFRGVLQLESAKEIQGGSQTGGLEEHFVNSFSSSRGPETVKFSSDNHSVRTQLRTNLQNADLAFHRLLVDHLRFSRQITQGREDEPTFVSTIIRGNLLLTDINKSVKLEKYQELTFEGLDGEIREIRVMAHKGIRVRFEGHAKKVVIGPGDFKYELTPTILEYFYHNQGWKVFLSAMGLLGGFLWSIRKIFLP